MKKKLVILALSLVLVLALSLSSCALLRKPKMSAYTTWAMEVEDLGLYISTYNATRISAYEKDVRALVQITKPVKRICHAYRSPQWVYIVEFSNESDAGLFYQSVTADLGYKGKISGATVIYGEDSVIAALK